MRITTPESYVTLHGRIKHETDKAIYFQVDKVEDDEIETMTHWFPLSQVNTIVRAAKDSAEFDSLVVKEWIAKQKDLL